MKPFTTFARALLAVLILCVLTVAVFSWMSPSRSATEHAYPLVAATANTTPNPLPPAKQTIVAIEIERQATAIADATAHPRQKPTPYFMPSSTPTATPSGTVVPNRAIKPLGDGWLAEAQAWMFGCGWCAVHTSMWYTYLDGQLISVVSGGSYDNPGVSRHVTQGWVQFWMPPANFQGAGEYPTPKQAGAVTIVDVVGKRLVLRAENGETFYFDVPARRYVSSLTEVAPTVTPIPLPRRPYP